MNTPAHRPLSARAQRGIALPVVLLLLLAITLPAMIMLRSALVNEKMASASIDRAAAFEAAESGLATAEAFALSRPNPPTSGCSSGICNTPDPTAIPVWEQTGFWDGANALSAPAVAGVNPRYVVEYMGVSIGLDQDCTTSGDVSPDAACNEEAFLYRVTVLGRTPSGAQAILQTSYLVP